MRGSHLDLFFVIYHNYILHILWSRRNRWGTTEDLTANFLHPSLASASLKASPSFRPVHSRMLSSHLFLWMPVALCPCTVPCKIVLASPFDRTTCPYHFSSLFFPHCSQKVIKRPDGLLNSVCVFPHWWCGLCTRCRGVCKSISSLWPVPSFLCLLLRSMIHRHTGTWRRPLQ